MGTSTHFGGVSVEMISTGSRWVTVSRTSWAGAASAWPLFQIHAETTGAERKATMASGLSGLEAVLMGLG